MILASNHQNAFLDALMIECSARKKSHFLARASAFKNKIALALLSYIRMMPIYRIRDGLGEVKKNDEIIEKCSSILRKGGVINLFPEGNHNLDWRVRSMQRGLARIVFDAATKDNWQTDIKIVPSGIQYESPTGFRSRVLVRFGKPLSVNKYKEVYEENNRAGMDELGKDLEEALKPLVVNLQPASDYAELREKYIESRPYKKDYIEQVNCDIKIAQALSDREALPEYSSDKPRRFYIHNYLFGIIAFANNILPFLITRALIRSIVKDPAFISSIKIACGIGVVPIFYIIQTTVVWYFFGLPAAAGYFVLLFVSGHFGFDWLKKLYNH